MRFTEFELTAALTGAAKTVLAAQSKDVRRGRRSVEQEWAELDRYRRFVLLDSLGDQLLPVLVALPDVEVAVGTRPAFTDREIAEVVESTMDDTGGRLRRKAVVAARVALVRVALESIPPRADPDALTVPDSL